MTEPDNHHNALVCPYCNPKQLVFGVPVSALRALVAEYARCAEGKRVADYGRHAAARAVYQMIAVDLAALCDAQERKA